MQKSDSREFKLKAAKHHRTSGASARAHPGVEALVAPHVLKRTFDVTAVNQVWCGGVT